jgi:hypothetical protein
MPDLPPVPVEGSALVETCDVCIVGAGLAGLNALFVASQYLGHYGTLIRVDVTAPLPVTALFNRCAGERASGRCRNAAS